MLHSKHTHYDVVMMHGSVEYCVRSACWELGTYARAYTVASYTHVLTQDHYCTSCMDVKRRVYETLQREQNGRLELAWSWVSL